MSTGRREDRGHFRPTRALRRRCNRDSKTLGTASFSKNAFTRADRDHRELTESRSMRLMFVHWLYEDRGSAQDVHNYAVAARALGHEVALYGPPNPQSPFNYSMDMGSADAVIFIFEWTTDLQFGDRLDWMRLVAQVPRERRVGMDCDGKYNESINVTGYCNHARSEPTRP